MVVKKKKIKPLRAHDHINKVTPVTLKFQPKPRKAKTKPQIKVQPKEKKMAQTSSSSAQASGAGATTTEAPVDPRVMELVASFVPAVGETAPTQDQKDLASQVWKLVEAAQKKFQDKQKAPDEGELKQASARFFTGDIAGAEARKKEEEQQKKDEAQQAAAQKAAGQTATAQTK